MKPTSGQTSSARCAVSVTALATGRPHMKLSQEMARTMTPTAGPVPSPPLRVDRIARTPRSPAAGSVACIETKPRPARPRASIASRSASEWSRRAIAPRYGGFLTARSLELRNRARFLRPQLRQSSGVATIASRDARLSRRPSRAFTR